MFWACSSPSGGCESGTFPPRLGPLGSLFSAEATVLTGMFALQNCMETKKYLKSK